MLVIGECQRTSQLIDTYVEVVANDHHGGVGASTLTLDLDKCELAVLGGLARLDTTKLLLTRRKDIVGTVEHARRCCADLHEVLANRFTDSGEREVKSRVQEKRR
jgi:hypothetical protein